MPPYPLTNIEIQKYYQNQPKFNGVYSRNNLPKIKDGAYVINLDEYESIETHWIALYVDGNKIIYIGPPPPPPPFIKGEGLSFQIFEKRRVVSDFSHKKGEIGKVRGSFLKKGGVSLIFILTNPFQCYLSECLVCVCVWVWVWVYVCMCVFNLLIPFLSVLLVFHRKIGVL